MGSGNTKTRHNNALLRTSLSRRRRGQTLGLEIKMTGYEKQSEAELTETFSQWCKIRYTCGRKGGWCGIISVLLGGGVFVAILSEGINLFYGVLAILAIVAFLIYKSEGKLSAKANEEIVLINQELNRRSFDFDLDISESRITHTHRSRYYPPEKSWTNSPAWAFEIPLTEFKDAAVDSVIELQCEPEVDGDEQAKLLVPVYFLNRHFDSFYFREDRKSISLFLSADPKNEFIEVRGNDGIDFSSYKKTK